MRRTTTELAQSALQLTAKERVKMAWILLESLPAPQKARLDRAWKREINKRLSDFEKKRSSPSNSKKHLAMPLLNWTALVFCLSCKIPELAELVVVVLTSSDIESDVL
jgi:putative addiction module component (TIGR02574 family)